VGAETVTTSSGTIASGTTSSNSTAGQTPFSGFWGGQRSQYLILASELAAAGYVSGVLSSLSFNVATKSSSIPYSGYTIKLAHTTSTTLSAGFLSPSFTTVYGPTAYTSVLGENNFSLGSSFSWDGTSNVLIDVCFNNGLSYSSSDAVTFLAKPYVATFGMVTDGVDLCGLTSGYSTTSTNALPNFVLTGQKVCSSPRVPVTATVNTPPSFGITGTQTICNNATAAMSVSSTLSSFNTYTWSPATGLFTDAAATVALQLLLLQLRLTASWRTSLSSACGLWGEAQRWQSQCQCD
jgi:hypothetical protein